MTKEKNETENSADPDNTTNTGLASLETSDIKLILFGALAFWGDSKVTQKEMDFLLEKTQENIKNIILATFTNPDDVELCSKEYLIELFSFIKEQEKNSCTFYLVCGMLGDFVRDKYFPVFNWVRGALCEAYCSLVWMLVAHFLERAQESKNNSISQI